MTATSFGTAQDGVDVYDIPDPTDWLNTPLAGLVPVEQALRCHVCKDFYNSPMITSCNHTFCSLCIRRCLNGDGKCPLCRVPNQESKLQGNWALREVVEAFVNARPALLEVARTPPPPATGTDAGIEVASRITRSPKRKAADLESPDSSQTKRTRISARLSRAKAAAEATDVVPDSDGDLSPAAEGSDIPSGDGLVSCPICHMRMKDWAVDRHLDKSCPGVPQDLPPAGSTAPLAAPTRPHLARRQAPAQSPPKRLPAINYSLLKDTHLRKKLVELGLSTAGSRALMERRHREWLTLWNANCDASRPKRRAELLKDLDVWERTLGGTASLTGSLRGSSSSSGGSSRSGGGGGAAAPQVKDKEFDGDAWGVEHDDSFRQLVAAARQNRPRVLAGTEDGTASAKGPGSGGAVHGTIVSPLDRPSSQGTPPGSVVDVTVQPGSSLGDPLGKESVDVGRHEPSDVVASLGKASDSRFFADIPPTSSAPEVGIDGAA